ncbi:Ppx/GppA family phosphatase [Candidatus Poribacteria bacterium]|nr:Ppx/GppA family phosphatase [Candidatus Poribacteria bacterium]
MRLAAIDVGTNSIHTVLVEVDDDLSLRILDSAKETVHLGRGLDSKENLTPRAMTDALSALRKAKILAESHQIDTIVAVATSALREAPNGLQFIRLIEQEAGIEVRVISGVEEARLIYLAVRESIHLDRRTFFGVDIGGGSVEVIWGTRRELLACDSLKLGVLRLSDHFPLSDPMTKAELANVTGYIDSFLTRLDEHAQAHPFETAVGTSGTFLELARLALGEAYTRPSRSLHQQIVSAELLRAVCDRIARSTVKDRFAMKGLDRTRVATIVPGAVLLRRLLDRFDIREVVACEYALREGVLFDYIEQNRSGLRIQQEMPDIRKRSVLALARRCDWKEAHSRHVAALCLMMFDQLADRFEWTREDRDLLEYAALLHDIGMLINVPSHHRHSQYLIENAELLGFTPREIAMMGQIARYHRRAESKKKHRAFAALAKADRERVKQLAGILRIAEGLDRTQFRIIQSVHCEFANRVLTITATPSDDAELELSSAIERTGPLSEALGCPVRIQLGYGELLTANLIKPIEAARPPQPPSPDSHTEG